MKNPPGFRGKVPPIKVSCPHLFAIILVLALSLHYPAGCQKTPGLNSCNSTTTAKKGVDHQGADREDENRPGGKAPDKESRDNSETYCINTCHISGSISEMTPLHKAVYRGELERAESLIRQGADLNARTGRGWTPLHLAASRGKADMIGLLLSRGALTSPQDRDGETPLHIAVYLKKFDCSRELARYGAEANARDSYGNTPLHHAREKEVIEFLLSKGADINAKDNQGQTLLMSCASSGNSEMMRFLVSKKADIKTRNRAGRTPLHTAAKSRSTAIAGFLMTQGLDVNCRDNNGWTPLHFAVWSKDSPMVDFLLSKGARIDAEDAFGQTPLFFASNPSYADTLIQKGADVHKRDKKGHTLLHHVVYGHGMWNRRQYGQVVFQWDVSDTMIGYYLSKGIYINARDEDGMTPLHYAAQLGYEKMARILLAYNAAVDSRNKELQTPLHLAGSGTTEIPGHHFTPPEVAELLLERGARINASDRKGNTPLDCAALSGNTGVEKLLRVRSARTSRTLPEEIMEAASRGDVGRIAEFLEKDQALIKARGPRNYTLLHCAVQKNRIETAKLLVARGADVNACSSVEYYTPLHLAVFRANLEMSRFLIDHGADVNARSALGTPLWCAHKPPMVRLLVERGADINVRFMGATLLHALASDLTDYEGEDRKEIAGFLLSMNASVNSLDDQGRTPLDSALGSEYDDMSDFLRSHGGKRSSELPGEKTIEKGRKKHR